MKVSVIMSTYNESIEEIDSCVNSILNQTYNNFNFFIAVDSPDRKDIIIYLKNIEKKDSRVKVFINKENLGLVKSLNMLLKKADGEFIFRMDADDISNKYRFEKQLKFMIDNSLDISATLVDFIDDNDKIIGKMKYVNNDYFNKELKKLMMYKNIMPHPSWCVKKTLYDSLGGYRPLEPAEDYDFLLRALRRNINIGLMKENLLSHRLRSNSISLTNRISQNAMSISLLNNKEKNVTISINNIINYKNHIVRVYNKNSVFNRYLFLNYYRSFLYIFTILCYNIKKFLNKKDIF